MHKNRQLEEECVTPIDAHSPVKMIEPYYTENGTPGTCLATCVRAAVLAAHIRVTIFSAGSKFRPVCNFT